MNPSKMLNPSPYLAFAASDDADGKRLVYNTEQRALYRVPSYLASSLEAGRVPKGWEERLLEFQLAIAATVDDARARVVERYRTAQQDTSRRTFVILTSSWCNMGCLYCGQNHVKSSPHAGGEEKLLERLRAAIEDPQTEQVGVAWFGGEPLMNFKFIRRASRMLVARASELGKPFDAAINTNGSLLSSDKLRELILKCNVRRFFITIDGPADHHNRSRILKGGGETYQHITETVCKARDDPEVSQSDCTFLFRTNVTPQLAQRIPDYIDDLARDRLWALSSAPSRICAGTRVGAL